MCWFRRSRLVPVPQVESLAEFNAMIEQRRENSVAIASDESFAGSSP